MSATTEVKKMQEAGIARRPVRAGKAKRKLTPYEQVEEWVWSRYMAFEGTFAFSMFEGWERLTLCE
jgi:hypothetical protein